jgi:hypothetical protein
MLAPIESPCRLSELGEARCRFIAGPIEADTLFCGAKTLRGKSYCEHHAAIVFWQPGREPALRRAA